MNNICCPAVRYYAVRQAAALLDVALCFSRQRCVGVGGGEYMFICMKNFSKRF